MLSWQANAAHGFNHISRLYRQATSDLRSRWQPEFSQYRPLDSPQYRPLDTDGQEFRLLKICQPAGSERLPVYEMHTTSIDEAPTYRALSYTWGEATPIYSIQVNGRPLDITANLYTFLEHFREPCYIYIDQICIDQHNVRERNHQVGMMSEIYSRCSSLIIWLSSDSSEFCIAVDELRHEFRQIPVANRSQNIVADDPRQKPVARPLSTLLRDSYFTRLWIVQEVLLARKISVFCRGVSGPVWISWGDLCKSVAGNRLWLRRMGYPESVITLLHDGHSVYSLIESLNWCIENFSGNACKDPRDKVYGLLGLVPAEDRMLFEIDYGKSVLEVFMEAVNATYHIRLLQRFRSTAVFLNCVVPLKSLAESMSLNDMDYDMRGLWRLLVDVHKLSDHEDGNKPPQVRQIGCETEGSQLDHWWYLGKDGKRRRYACCVCHNDICSCDSAMPRVEPE